jgi:hypothetical protein
LTPIAEEFRTPTSEKERAPRASSWLLVGFQVWGDACAELGAARRFQKGDKETKPLIPKAGAGRLEVLSAQAVLVVPLDTGHDQCGKWRVLVELDLDD